VTYEADSNVAVILEEDDDEESESPLDVSESQNSTTLEQNISQYENDKNDLL
jgi:hypothetical protein